MLRLDRGSLTVYSYEVKRVCIVNGKKLETARFVGTVRKDIAGIKERKMGIVHRGNTSYAY